MTVTLSGTSEMLQSYNALKIYAVATKTNTPILKKVSTDAEMKQLTPLSRGMAITLPDNNTNSTVSMGGTSSSMTKILASYSPGYGLLGHGDYNAAQVDSWVSSGITNLEVPFDALILAKTVHGANSAQIGAVVESITKELDYFLSVLNCHVMYSTYMVEDHVTIADIALVSALYHAAKENLWDPSSDDEKTVNLTRWYNTIVNQDFFKEALSMMTSTSSAPTTSSVATTLPSSSDAMVASMNGVAPPVINKLYRRNRIRIKELLQDPSKYFKQTITVAGWTKTVRKASSKLVFLELNDGSTGASIQCICESATCTVGFEDAKKSGGTGSSFQLVGTLEESPAAGQVVEFKVTQCELLGAVYGGDLQGKTVGGANYPMSKKGHTLEHMREHAHLRPRVALHAAAMRIRHAMAYATHKFFHDHGFVYVHTPIITCADCEGAGEQFGVTTMLGADHLKPDVKIPVHEAPKPVLGEDGKPVEEKKLSKKEQKRLAKKAKQDAAKAQEGEIIAKPTEEEKVIGAVDYTGDFFGKRANLTVSGQLNVETHACAMSDVYTFGPTFRAENSHTARHLCEFWMIEPEIAFANLVDDMNLAEDYLKYCVEYALAMCADDLEFFEQSAFGEVGLRDRLKNVLDNPFKRLTYTEGIEILEKAYNEEGVKFEVKPEWGIDLPSEHERYLCETVFKKPVVLTDYPKGIKAFYMKLNEDQKTVSAADILVPKIGEIIGGSQREHRMDVLIERCKESGLDPKHVWWYIDLRKYGTVPHAGFGLGFERLILFITGLDNIRDVIPFPRWAGKAEF